MKKSTDELLVFPTVFDFDDGLASFGNDLEREVFEVRLDFNVVKLATDEPLSIKDSVVGVHGDLILRGVSDETPRVGEGDIRRGYSVALVVGNDFWEILSDSARVGKVFILFL